MCVCVCVSGWLACSHSILIPYTIAIINIILPYLEPQHTCECSAYECCLSESCYRGSPMALGQTWHLDPRQMIMFPAATMPVGSYWAVSTATTPTSQRIGRESVPLLIDQSRSCDNHTPNCPTAQLNNASQIEQ